ncbi:MAG: hypothetical protein U0271_37550 [Polyangiaceae bacterium]
MQLASEVETPLAEAEVEAIALIVGLELVLELALTLASALALLLELLADGALDSAPEHPRNTVTPKASRKLAQREKHAKLFIVS